VAQLPAASYGLRQAAEAASQVQLLQLLQLAYARGHLLQALQAQPAQLAASASLEEVLWQTAGTSAAAAAVRAEVAICLLVLAQCAESNTGFAAAHLR
jgi:hypothetical protein